MKKPPFSINQLQQNARLRRSLAQNPPSAVSKAVSEQNLQDIPPEKLSAEDKAEYERIQKAIESAKQRLEVLEKGRPANYKARNYRYVLDTEVPFEELFAGPISGQTPLLYENSFTVKKDTKFYTSYLECSTYAIGTPLEGSTQLSLAIRPYLRPEYLQFEWAVRDTGSDRAWQSDFLPMGILKTNRINSLDLASPTVLSGGSEVFIQLQISRMRVPFSFNYNLFESINKFIIQFSFAGYEVSEK
jgi:hypothetical protein